MIFSFQVGIIATDGLEKPLFLKCKKPKYTVLLDCLDGDSNMGCNVTVGTIFGVYKTKNPDNPSIYDCMQPGKNLLCSGYAIYGNATMLVLTLGDSVQGFTLDPEIGA